MRTETLILNSLAKNEEFTRLVLPHVKKEYFQEKEERMMFLQLRDHFVKYNKLPSKEAIDLSFSESEMEETTYNNIQEVIEDVWKTNSKQDVEWLRDTTETWCQDMAMHNAILESINIEQGASRKPRSAIRELVKEALAVTFDTSVGHDYYEDAEERFAAYRRKDAKYDFPIPIFNQITNGGVPRKTLNICLAESGLGKSIWLCNLAAHYMSQGLNVLYITMEMDEKVGIAKRIDANLMDLPINDLHEYPDRTLIPKLEKIKQNSAGRLIVKEFPTAGAHSGHFRTLMEELKMKKDFQCDILIVDYLNICLCERYSDAGNSYNYVKSIAEELRGIAVEHNLVCWTATQANRSGYGNHEMDLTNVSDSMGTVMTADFIFGMFSTEQLKAMNMIGCTLLKNRFGDKSQSAFSMAIDYTRMRFFEVDDASVQAGSGDNIDDTSIDDYGKTHASSADYGNWDFG